MRLPHLNRKMVLEAPQRVPDGSGGFSISWTALGTVWASLKPGSGREVGGVAVTLSRTPVRIVVRAAPVGQSQRPEPDQRFREGSRTFVIQAVRESDPHGRYLTCHAIEEVAA